MGQEEKPWFYRLQMVANIMIARRKDGMTQKMLAEKNEMYTTVHVKWKHFAIREIKCKGK